MSMTRDGRDRSSMHKRSRIHVPPGSGTHGHGAWMDGVGPMDDELIFNRTGSNIFTTTNMHYVLSNLGWRLSNQPSSLMTLPIDDPRH